MNLEAIAPIIEDIIKKSLEERRYPFGFTNYRGIGNKVASGKLKDSVQVQVRHSAKHMDVLQVLMIEYGQYVQAGRKPGKKFVPILPLLEWIKARKLKGRDKKGKFISNKSFAFAISRNINKYGIRSANFLDISIEKIMNDSRITELLGEAGYEELINTIQGI